MIGMSNSTDPDWTAQQKLETGLVSRLDMSSDWIYNGDLFLAAIPNKNKRMKCCLPVLLHQGSIPQPLYNTIVWIQKQKPC